MQISYSSIKKKCYGDHALPSQVATKFNLTKDKGYDSIVTKIIIQMCAKLGKSVTKFDFEINELKLCHGNRNNI